MWSEDDKRRIGAVAPLGAHLLRPESQIIERPGSRGDTPHPGSRGDTPHPGSRGDTPHPGSRGDTPHPGPSPWPSWYQIITPTSPYARSNEIVHGDIESADPDTAIDEVFATYRALGVPFKWCVYPWTKPSDLAERLVKRGATQWDVRAMVCDTSLALAMPEGASVERVSQENLALYIDTMARGWDTPPDEARFFLEECGKRIEAGTSEMFLARWHGDPAATAGTVLKDGYGYLVGGNVLPAHRGRGIYRALLESRLASLRERGMTLATTQAREATSAPMLEHLGFETVFRYTIYQFEA